MTVAFQTRAPVALLLLGLVLLLAAGQAVARQSTPDALERTDQHIFAGDQLDRVVYFDLDSAEVRPEAAPKLNAQASWLLHNPWAAVRIEGNTDQRGSHHYNLALGTRRAQAVRDYLINRGVAPSRIETISFGEERPVAEGSSDDASARNRNTYTVIIPDGAQ